MPLTNGDEVSEELLHDGQSVKPRAFRYWAFEILTLLFATGLFIAIAFVLIHYNGSFLTDWPLPINLNTVVALLSTVFRASLVMVLAEILSQTKWTWFRDGSRPLSDLQVYDEASRGLLGSFKLLGVLRGGFRGNLLALGAAIVTILSLAVGPFTQQAIKTVDCLSKIPGGLGANATVLTANWIPRLQLHYDQYYDTIGIVFEDPMPKTGLKSAMISALVHDEVANNATLFTCSTRDCRFPETDGISYTTIGVCSECVDPAELATYEDDTTMFGTVILGDFEMDLREDYCPRLAVNTSDHDFVDSIVGDAFKKRLRHSWASVSAITQTSKSCSRACPFRDDDPDCSKADEHFVAATCFLYPCIKNLAGRVENGTLFEDIVSTQAIPGTTSEGFDPSLFNGTMQSSCVVGQTTYSTDDPSFYTDIAKNGTALTEMKSANLTEMEPSECFYGFGQNFASKLSDYLSDTFFQETYGVSGPAAYSAATCSEAWWLESMLWMTNMPGRSFENLEKKFHNIAIAMTNYFRTTGEYGTIGNPHRTVGVAHGNTLCMELEWPWLLLPASLYLLSIALLAGVVAKNRLDHRQAAWKSSLLPLLFFGLERKVEGDVGPPYEVRSEEPKAYEAVAKLLEVQLKADPYGQHSKFSETSHDVTTEAAEVGRRNAGRGTIDEHDMRAHQPRRTRGRSSLSTSPGHDRDSNEFELLDRANNGRGTRPESP